MAALIVAYLVLWVPLVFVGRALGRRWGNPDAGLWLPAILGALGFAMFAASGYQERHRAIGPGR